MERIRESRRPLACIIKCSAHRQRRPCFGICALHDESSIRANLSFRFAIRSAPFSAAIREAGRDQLRITASLFGIALRFFLLSLLDIPKCAKQFSLFLPKQERRSLDCLTTVRNALATRLRRRIQQLPVKADRRIGKHTWLTNSLAHLRATLTRPRDSHQAHCNLRLGRQILCRRSFNGHQRDRTLNRGNSFALNAVSWLRPGLFSAGRTSPQRRPHAS
jgi:hypothetical protein